MTSNQLLRLEGALRTAMEKVKASGGRIVRGSYGLHSAIDGAVGRTIFGCCALGAWGSEAHLIPSEYDRRDVVAPQIACLARELLNQFGMTRDEREAFVSAFDDGVELRGEHPEVRALAHRLSLEFVGSFPE